MNTRRENDLFREDDIFTEDGSERQADSMAEQARLKQLARTCRSLCSTEDGRAFVRHVIGLCNPLLGGYVESTQAAYYVQGKRDMGLALLGLFHHSGCAVMDILLPQQVTTTGEQ